MFAVTQAQVQFSILSPSNIACKEIPFTDNGATGDWGLPNLLDPMDAITDTLVLAEDGTPGVNPQGIDSTYECCNAITNNVAGKIAVIYRNTCSFGTKALNAVNAGAVGVIIINREPGLVNMLGGTEGLSVFVPVIFISNSDGALLRAELDGGADVVAFIGNKNGLFMDDIGMKRSNVLMAEQTAIPQMLATSAAEFDVTPGGWVQNYGSNAQANVTLTCDIYYGGSSVYSQTSSPFAIPANDSFFVSTLPVFSQASYPVGNYTMVYTTDDVGITDSFPCDNSIYVNFMITDGVYAYAPMDTIAVEPIPTTGIMPGSATPSTIYESCINFRDPNASRMAVDGLYFSTVKNAPDSLTGELVELYAYTWDNIFVDLNDAGLAYDQINLLEIGSYDYLGDSANTIVYGQFDNGFQLVDNQRYLFCVRTYGDVIFHGFNTDLDYSENVNLYLQPVGGTIFDSGTWNWVGFGTDYSSTIGVRMIDAATLSVEESEPIGVNTFPNPATSYLNIDFGERTGNTYIEIIDMTGRVVATQSVNLNGSSTMVIDISELSSGTYSVRTTFENGEVNADNIVISK